CVVARRQLIGCGKVRTAWNGKCLHRLPITAGLIHPPPTWCCAAPRAWPTSRSMIPMAHGADLSPQQIAERRRRARGMALKLAAFAVFVYVAFIVAFINR